MEVDGAQVGTPSATVYVRNLDERVKVESLVEHLQSLFEDYGDIIDIVAKKSLKRKGQAFIVFDNVESAQNAIEEIQGFELFDKPMKLEFARTRSDATVKREGTEEDFEQHKRRRLAEKDRKQALQAAEAQKKAPAGTEAPKPRAAAKTGNAVIPDEYVPPNKILFLQNLPKDADTDTLTEIFQRFDGFREIRTVPGRKGIAFVEYDSEQQAITAKESTANMPVGAESKPMKVTYQRQ